MGYTRCGVARGSTFAVRLLGSARPGRPRRGCGTPAPLRRCLDRSTAGSSSPAPMSCSTLLAGSVPWHEERMRMYDSTVRVPRLLARYRQGRIAAPLRPRRSPVGTEHPLRAHEPGAPFSQRRALPLPRRQRQRRLARRPHRPREPGRHDGGDSLARRPCGRSHSGRGRAAPACACRSGTAISSRWEEAASERGSTRSRRPALPRRTDQRPVPPGLGNHLGGRATDAGDSWRSPVRSPDDQPPLGRHA